MGKVCVVGSINMDLTIETDKMPAKGQTVLGKRFNEYPGGKGANQAVAASRLGAEVDFIGAVGKDLFGEKLKKRLHLEGIQTKGIIETDTLETGVANIILSQQDNRIIVAPGANNAVTPIVVKQFEEIIKNADILLLQLEIPMESVKCAVDIAWEHQVPIILNPAPYQKLSKSMIEKITYLTPNELEAAELEAERGVDMINFLNKLIITEGKAGVNFSSNGEMKQVKGLSVNVKDTTGAGDTFNGALAMQLAEKKPLEEAVYFANAAAALSVTKRGAQVGMPTKQPVIDFIGKGVK
ncbi:ribokinase [Paraliobacillus salinarum]|uniref:ribokinase n=1 Tax=Paraliobacillus salinarum TaxID=1158996 RepID=UPI0015F359F1|nr:ribokinase [Paraliobacillus salinarum]